MDGSHVSCVPLESIFMEIWRKKLFVTTCITNDFCPIPDCYLFFLRQLVTNLLHACWTGFLVGVCMLDQGEANERVGWKCDSCHRGQRCWHLMEQIIWSSHGHTAWEMGCPFRMLVVNLYAAVPYVSLLLYVLSSMFMCSDKLLNLTLISFVHVHLHVNWGRHRSSEQFYPVWCFLTLLFKGLRTAPRRWLGVQNPLMR